MTNAATLLDTNAPALARVRALIALIMQLLFKPDAAAQIDAMLADAEAQAARYLLDYAVRHHECGDLDPDDFDVRLVWRGAELDLDIRRKALTPADAQTVALHPMYQIIVARHYARRLARNRRVQARRRRMSFRHAIAFARIDRRRTARDSAQHRELTRFPLSASCARPALPP